MQSLQKLDSVEIFNGVVTEATVHDGIGKSKFIAIKVLNRICIVLILDVVGNVKCDVPTISLLTASQDILDEYIVGSTVKIRNEIIFIDGNQCNHYTLISNNFFHKLFDELLED